MAFQANFIYRRQALAIRLAEMHRQSVRISDLPSALAAVDQIAPPEAELAIFLDYDGTLTPIVDRPEDAVLSDSIRETIRALAQRTPVTLVSGREREEVARLVGIEELGAVGSHGFDLRGPAGSALRHEVATDSLPILDVAEQELREKFKSTPGILVERKRFGIAIHYRLASPEDARIARHRVETLGTATDGLRLCEGKMVIELRPDVDWDKGQAVLYLLEKLGWERRTPIHIGDDLTDESVFQALKERGIGIYVGKDAAGDRETSADFRLADPAEVGVFLAQLAERP